MEAKSDVERQLTEKVHAKLAVDLMLTRCESRATACVCVCVYVYVCVCVYTCTRWSPQESRDGWMSHLGFFTHAAKHAFCLRTQGEEGHRGFE